MVVVVLHIIGEWTIGLCPCVRVAFKWPLLSLFFISSTIIPSHYPLLLFSSPSFPSPLLSFPLSYSLLPLSPLVSSSSLLFPHSRRFTLFSFLLVLSLLFSCLFHPSSCLLSSLLLSNPLFSPLSSLLSCEQTMTLYI